MGNFLKLLKKKQGKPPGTLEYIGDTVQKVAQFQHISYCNETYKCRALQSTDLKSFSITPNTKNWLYIKGVPTKEELEVLGSVLNIHRLTLEDILNTEQRPKTELFENYIYVIVQAIHPLDYTQNFDNNQFNIIIFKDLVVTIEERDTNASLLIKSQIERGIGKIRNLDHDFLAYSIIDAIIDNYYIILDQFNEKIEHLEDDIVDRPSKALIHDIHDLKREVWLLRKNIWPLRECITKLDRSVEDWFSTKSKPFFRDLYDHTYQIIDICESLRDVIASMLDTYLSSISFKMNDIMKVLTIISTIFMPMTLITGIYGMNFENMPELGWQYGYQITVILILSLGAIMLLWFWKKKWL